MLIGVHHPLLLSSQPLTNSGCPNIISLCSAFSQPCSLNENTSIWRATLTLWSVSQQYLCKYLNAISPLSVLLDFLPDICPSMISVHPWVKANNGYRQFKGFTTYQINLVNNC